jgi:hypothetical protein
MFNIDGVADIDHFQKLDGELQLGVKYCPEFVAIVGKCLEDMGINTPFWKIDVGASDAVTFCRAGMKAYTFVAQDNTPRNTYHTFHDTLDNMNHDTMPKMMELILRVLAVVKEKLEGPGCD